MWDSTRAIFALFLFIFEIFDTILHIAIFFMQEVNAILTQNAIK